LAQHETFSSFIAKRKNNNFKNKKLVKISNLLSEENNILREKDVR